MYYQIRPGDEPGLLSQGLSTRFLKFLAHYFHRAIYCTPVAGVPMYYLFPS